MKLDELDLNLIKALLEQQRRRQEGAARVKICTKEKCPKCKKPFQETPLGLICPKCFTVPKRYFIYFSHNGRRIRIYSFRDGQPLSSWELAKRAQELITHEIENGTFDPSRWVKSDLREYLFSVRLEDYLERIKPNLKPSSFRDKRWHLLRALRIIGDVDVREIRAHHVEKLKTELERQGRKPKTVKNALTELHAFLNDLKRLEYIERVPNFPTVKVPEPVIRYLEPETLQVILENIPEPHRDIFLFMFTYGCRPSEARALCWDCVDFRNGTILIKRNFSRGVLVDIPKEGDWKALPIVDVIDEMLERRYRRKHSFFVFEHKPRFNRWTHYGSDLLRELFKEACRKAGIENPPTLYQAIRHSVAMDLLNSGYTYEAVARLLGHKHLSTTKRYGKLRTETVRPLARDRIAKLVNLEDYRRKKTSDNRE